MLIQQSSAKVEYSKVELEMAVPDGLWRLCYSASDVSPRIGIANITVVAAAATGMQYTSAPLDANGILCETSINITVTGSLSTGDSYFLQYPHTEGCQLTPSEATTVVSGNLSNGVVRLNGLTPQTGIHRFCYQAQATGLPFYSSLGFITVQADQPPIITKLEGCGAEGTQLFNCPTNGTAPITVHGQFLGSDDSQVRIGGGQCDSVSFSGDQSSGMLVGHGCKGTGEELKVHVFTASGLYASSGNMVVSYAPKPTITKLTGCMDYSPVTASCPTSGNTPITISGSNFDNVQQVRIGDGTCNSIDIVNPSQIVCNGYPQTNATSLPVSVTNQWDEHVTAYNVYFTGIPEVHGVTGCLDSTDPKHTRRCPTNGRRMVTIIGRNFDSPGLLRVWVGQVQCGFARLINDTMVECSFYPGNGTGHVIRVQASEEYSVATDVFLDYSPVPVVKRVTGCSDDQLSTFECPVTGPTAGSSAGVLTITGSDFGDFDISRPAKTTGGLTDRVMLGNIACNTVVLISDITLECREYSGLGALHVVSVVVDGEASHNHGMSQLVTASPTDVVVSFAEPCDKNADGLVCNGVGICNALTKTCKCRTGETSGYWTGKGCDQCQEGYYGSDCRSMCPKVNGETCAGHGTCNDGLTGDGTCTCNTVAGLVAYVPAGTCEYECPAHNGVPCTSAGTPCIVDGGAGAACICNDGVGYWTPSCSDCASNYYGPKCDEACDCSGHGQCKSGTASTGGCLCDDGYTGLRCHLACPGTTSACSGHGTCSTDSADGTAVCQCSSSPTEGYWAGTACDVCHDDYRGSPHCNVSCPKHSGSICSSNGECWNGGCRCTATGICGPFCNLTDCAQYTCSGSNEGRWGTGCSQTCPGYIAASSNTPVQVCGGSTRSTGCDNTQTGSGTCFCMLSPKLVPMYLGTTCELQCPVFNGEPCGGALRGTCTDSLTTSCSTGTCATCTCKTGYFGPACEQTCPGGAKTPCSNNGTCTAAGLCECNAPYMGLDCSLRCPGGAAASGGTWQVCYGNGQCVTDKLTAVCTCASANFDPTYGCQPSKCVFPYLGVHCNETCIVSATCGGHGACYKPDDQSPPRCNCGGNWNSSTACTTCNHGFWGPSCTAECPGGSCYVCHGHGQCDGVTGVCACTGKYHGSDCSVCLPGWGGDNCNLPCPESSGKICGGHGTCLTSMSTTPVCECHNSQPTGYWGGTDCSVCSAKAYGPSCLLCPGDGDCNGHGTCDSGVSGSGTCQCDNGFWGTTCSKLCPGMDQGQPCYGHGICNTTTGTCSCFASGSLGFWDAGTQCTSCVRNYYGSSCRAQCLATNGNVCNGHGKCFDGQRGNGTCACDPGFMGYGCTRKCPRGPNDRDDGGDDFEFCGNHATGCTVDLGTCLCYASPTEGYWALDDQYFSCLKCNTGWAGSTCTLECETTIKPLLCTNNLSAWNSQYLADQKVATCLVDAASCAPYKVCSAPHKWGANCEKDCPGLVTNTTGVLPCSGHGWCHAGNSTLHGDKWGKCFCTEKYFGVDCSLTCAPCSVGGTCNPTNGACDCKPGWYGPSCQYKCGPSVTNPCNGHGTCNEGNMGDGNCTCAKGYWGKFCESSCAPSITDPCSGHGECVQCQGSCPSQAQCRCFNDSTLGHWTDSSAGAVVDNCDVCAQGWHGIHCTTPCVHGRSIGGQCQCNWGWWGSNCDQQCPRAANDNVCNSPEGATGGAVSGVCQADGTCTCASNWYGSACTVYCSVEACTNGSKTSVTLVHPVCNSNGQCECSSNSEGWWAGTLCDECADGFWGSTCTNACPCSGHGSCGKATGQPCVCSASPSTGYWDGPSCNECAAGWVGEGCAEVDVQMTRSSSITFYDVTTWNPLDAEARIDGVSLIDETRQLLVAGSKPIVVASLATKESAEGHDPNGYTYSRCGVSMYVSAASFNPTKDSIFLMVDSSSSPELSATFMFPWGDSSRDGDLGNATHPQRFYKLSQNNPDLVIIGSTCPGTAGASAHVLHAPPSLQSHRRAMRTQSTSSTIYELFIYKGNLYRTDLTGLQVKVSSINLLTWQATELVSLSIGVELSNNISALVSVLSTEQYVFVGGTVDAVPCTDPAAPDTTNIKKWEIIRIHMASIVATPPSPNITYLSPRFPSLQNCSSLNVFESPQVMTYDKANDALYVGASLVVVDQAGAPQHKGVALLTIRSLEPIVSIVTSTLRTDNTIHCTAMAQDVYTNTGYFAYHTGSATSTQQTESKLIKFNMTTGKMYGTTALYTQRTRDNQFPEQVKAMGVDQERRQLMLFAPASYFQVIPINLYAVTGLDPMIADTRGYPTFPGTRVTIIGEGFVNSSEVSCWFLERDNNAQLVWKNTTRPTYLSPTRIVCEAVEGSDDDCSGRPVEVRMFNGQAMTVNGRRLLRAPAPQINAVSPERGSLTFTQEVGVSGYGFKQTASLSCRFAEPGPGGRSYITQKVIYVNSSHVICQQPYNESNPAVTEPMTKGSKVEISLDGQQYSSTVDRSGYAITGLPAGLWITQPTTWTTKAQFSGSVQKKNFWTEIVPAGGGVRAAKESRLYGSAVEGNTVQPLSVFIVDSQKQMLLSLLKGLNVTFTVTARLVDAPAGWSHFPNLSTALRQPGRNLSQVIQNSTSSDELVIIFTDLYLPYPRAGMYTILFSEPQSLWSYNYTFQVLEGEVHSLVLLRQPGSHSRSDVGSLYEFNVSKREYVVQQPLLVRHDVAGNTIAFQHPDDKCQITIIPMIMPDRSNNTVSIEREVAVDPSNGQFAFTKATVSSTPGQVSGGLHGEEYIMSFRTTATKLEVNNSRRIVVAPCGFEGSNTQVDTTKYARPWTMVCDPCPDHAICNGTMNFSILPGYWRHRHDSVYIYECTHSSACKGGFDNGELCSQGYKASPMCSECSDGYGHNSAGECVRCPVSTTINVFFVILMAVIVFLFLAIMIITSLRPRRTEVLPILGKILVNHLQVCSKIGDMQMVDPARILERILEFEGDISEINPNILSVECITRWNYYEKWIHFMILPFGILGVVLLVLLLMALYRWMTKQQPVGLMPLAPSGVEIDPSRPYNRELEEVRPPSPPVVPADKISWVMQEYERPPVLDDQPKIYDETLQKMKVRTPIWRIICCATVVIMFVIYPTVIENCARIFQCDIYQYGTSPDKADGEVNLLRIDRTLECNTSEHSKYTGASYAFFALYGLGLPLVTVGVVLIFRLKRGAADVEQLFAFLLRGYRPKLWFWEVVVMMRKLITVAIIVFIHDSTLEVYAFMWTIGVFLALHLALRPYEEEVLYNMEALSLLSIYVTSTLVLLFNPKYQDSISQSTLDFIEWFLICVNTLVLVYLVAWTVIEVKRRISIALAEVKMSIRGGPDSMQAQYKEQQDTLQQLVELRREHRKLTSDKETLINCNKILEQTCQDLEDELKDLGQMLPSSRPVTRDHSVPPPVPKDFSMAPEPRSGRDQSMAPLPRGPQDQSGAPPQPPPVSKGTTETMENWATFTKQGEAMAKEGRRLYTFKNGDTFQGEWHNGQMHGYGVYTYATSGNRYEGEYEHHLKHGYGIFTYRQTGIVHKGNWKKGVKEGPGTTIFPNGDRYVGNFSANEFNGFGEFMHSNGDRYAGNWEHSAQEGHGSMFYVDGTVYEGAWKDSKKHGKGKYTTQLSTYEGDWHDGLMHGHGSQSFSDGSWYEGNFQRGQRHGWGVFTDFDGSKYEGGWSENQRFGQATFHYPNGARCIGQWKNNEMHGPGVYIAPDGARMAVNYEFGKCVKNGPQQ